VSADLREEVRRARLLTVEEVADRLRTTPAAIYCLRYRGEGPPAVRVGKRLLHDEADLEAWLRGKSA
jgi:predicted DNA-binding transcriptional regulator AlpA